MFTQYIGVLNQSSELFAYGRYVCLVTCFVWDLSTYTVLWY